MTTRERKLTVNRLRGESVAGINALEEFTKNEIRLAERRFADELKERQDFLKLILKERASRLKTTL